MEITLNKVIDKIKSSDFIHSFIDDLSNVLKNNKGDNMNNIELTANEELEFDRKEFMFLQDYFKKELNHSDGEIYIVTNKYENDNKYHRYKITQYKNNKECKYIAFEKDLPANVKIQDVIRKVNDKYIYDEQATQYVKQSRNKIKQDIIENRQN